jgi:putative ABC transport system substrate-binding protein
MRRREFIALLGGAASAFPHRLSAQLAGKIFRIGMAEPVPAELNVTNLSAFRQELRELGYVEGQNLVIEYRSADGDASRFPALISELIGLGVDLIVTRGTPASLAARRASTTIPVVMAALGEPLLVVESLARPGGNITGLSGVVADLDAKRIELIKEMAPATSGIAAMLNMSNPITRGQLTELEPAARSKGLRFRLFDVRGRDDIERAFNAPAAGDAIVVGFDGLTQAYRHRIAELAARHRMPAIYGGREFIEAGGLMFYGPNFADSYRRAAHFVDKIFKGAKPADLPVEQPTKFELVINGKAAKALGLDIPASLLLRADEVIE